MRVPLLTPLIKLGKGRSLRCKNFSPAALIKDQLYKYRKYNKARSPELGNKNDLKFVIELSAASKKPQLFTKRVMSSVCFL